MRRTISWWNKLTAAERSELVALERAGARASTRMSAGSAYLPDGYSDCEFCSTPTSVGLCVACLDRLIALVDKADRRCA